MIGNSNLTICKRLIKICPECLVVYMMLRAEALKNGKTLETTDDSENDGDERLVIAFNDEEVSDEEFGEMLAEADQRSVAFIRLNRRLSTIK